MLSTLLVIAALQSAAADPTPASVQKQLRADDQALLDAIGRAIKPFGSVCSPEMPYTSMKTAR